MKLYAIRDSRAGFFLPVMEAHNDAHAMRTVYDALSHDHPIVHHRDDYHLYCLGEYDNEAGQITPILPEPVISISEMIAVIMPRDPEQVDLEEPLAEAKINGIDDQGYDEESETSS